MTDGAIETVVGRTSQERIRLVRFRYADYGWIIRGKLDPGEAVNVDPANLSEAERAIGGARRLPASLAAALDALSTDAAS